MPVYDFKCKECGKEFSVKASLDELEKGEAAKCPDCKGSARQLLTAFMAKTSRKS